MLERRPMLNGRACEMMPLPLLLLLGMLVLTVLIPPTSAQLLHSTSPETELTGARLGRHLGHLGGDLFRLGLHLEAATAFARSLLLVPDTAVWNSLATALYHAHLGEMAVACFMHVLTLDYSYVERNPRLHELMLTYPNGEVPALAAGKETAFLEFVRNISRSDVSDVVFVSQLFALLADPVDTNKDPKSKFQFAIRSATVLLSQTNLAYLRDAAAALNYTVLSAALTDVLQHPPTEWQTALLRHADACKPLSVRATKRWLELQKQREQHEHTQTRRRRAAEQDQDQPQEQVQGHGSARARVASPSASLPIVQPEGRDAVAALVLYCLGRQVDVANDLVWNVLHYFRFHYEEAYRLAQEPTLLSTARRLLSAGEYVRQTLEFLLKHVQRAVTLDVRCEQRSTASDAPSSAPGDGCIRTALPLHLHPRHVQDTLQIAAYFLHSGQAAEQPAFTGTDQRALAALVSGLSREMSVCVWPAVPQTLTDDDVREWAVLVAAASVAGSSPVRRVSAYIRAATWSQSERVAVDVAARLLELLYGRRMRVYPDADAVLAAMQRPELPLLLPHCSLLVLLDERRERTAALTSEQLTAVRTALQSLLPEAGMVVASQSIHTQLDEEMDRVKWLLPIPLANSTLMLGSRFLRLSTDQRLLMSTSAEPLLADTTVPQS